MHAGVLAGTLTAAALILTGCAVADGAPTQPPPDATDGGPPSPAPSPQPSPAAPGQGGYVMDWIGPFELALSGGRVVRDCDGDRTHVCVYDGDVLLGDAELLNGYPLDERETGQSTVLTLQERAEDFIAHFREDRAQGCAGFEFVAEGIGDAVVGGQPGKRAAFHLLDGDGRTVERVINYFTIQDDTLAIVNVDAYVDEGGCLAPSEYDPSFAPAVLAELVAELERSISETPLPTPR